jgi:hypothetical protein
MLLFIFFPLFSSIYRALFTFFAHFFISPVYPPTTLLLPSYYPPTTFLHPLSVLFFTFFFSALFSALFHPPSPSFSALFHLPSPTTLSFQVSVHLQFFFISSLSALLWLLNLSRKKNMRRDT